MTTGLGFVEIKRLIAVMTVLAVLGLCVSARPADAATTSKKVLFYELQAKEMSVASGYSQFYSYLQKAGYSTAFLNNKLSWETIQNYDVLVLQKLSTPLDSGEISAILQFLRQGGGVFINGNEPAGVNNIAQIFGITMVGDYLVDTSSPVTPNAPDKYQFILEKPKYAVEQAPDLKDVESIGFYKGYPLRIDTTTTNARVFLRAGKNAFSEGGTFSVNSEPPVAAVAFIEGGAVVVLSDTDMLSNTNIDTFNNSKLGREIIDWLADPNSRSLSTATNSELLSRITELSDENVNLSTEMARLQLENSALNERLLQVENDLNKTLSGMPLTSSVSGLGFVAEFVQNTSPLTVGAVAGIVIAAVAGIAVFITIAVISAKRKKEESESASGDEAALTESVSGGAEGEQKNKGDEKEGSSSFLGGEFKLDLGEAEAEGEGESKETEGGAETKKAGNKKTKIKKK